MFVYMIMVQYLQKIRRVVRMKNKIILLFGVLVLGLVALVMAIGEGDIITQEQLDSIDADTFNLQCQLEDIGQSHKIEVGGHWYYYRNVSCLSIEPLDIDNPTDGYLITRPNHFPHFLISDYFNCRRNNNAQYCNGFYTEVLVRQHRDNKEVIRNTIRQYQTIEGDEEDTDFEDDFEL